MFTTLEQAALNAYDKIVGLGLEDLCVDGCIVKAPCGGQAAGPSPVDRGKQGTKRSVMVEGHGIPVGVQVAPANCQAPGFVEAGLSGAGGCRL